MTSAAAGWHVLSIRVVEESHRGRLSTVVAESPGGYQTQQYVLRIRSICAVAVARAGEVLMVPQAPATAESPDVENRLDPVAVRRWLAEGPTLGETQTRFPAEWNDVSRDWRS